MSVFQMVGLPDLRSHSKSWPFTNQPLLTIWNPEHPDFWSPLYSNTWHKCSNQTKNLTFWKPLENRTNKSCFVVFGHLDGDCISAALKVVFLDVSGIWASGIRRVTVFQLHTDICYRHLGISYGLMKHDFLHNLHS